MSQTNLEPRTWPLLFAFSGPIVGSGFLAGIQIRGRLLARLEEDGRFWLEGVAPGGFALPVPTLEVGGSALTHVLTGVFADLAEEYNTFPAFKAAVEEFCATADDAAQIEWHELVKAIQAGKIPNLPGLPVLPANTPVSVSVVEIAIDDAKPANNSSVNQALAAAA